jgi:hypothetical protein
VSLEDSDQRDRLFALLGSTDAQVNEQVWELLSLLPYPDKLLNEARHMFPPRLNSCCLRMPSPLSDAVVQLRSQPGNWSALLDKRNVYRMIYSLQGVRLLLEDPSPAGRQWTATFTQAGGVKVRRAVVSRRRREGLGC